MDVVTIITYLSKQFISIRKHFRVSFLIQCIILTGLVRSCETDPYTSNWVNDGNPTICQYLETNKEEYSKFYTLLDSANLLSTLCAYNPYAEGYTLFLPTNEAIDHFIQQNQNYATIEELLLDTAFIYTFTRYHTINEKVQSDEFPYGALIDSTLTGDRLAFGFFTESDKQVIKVNNVASIIELNLKMTNGYIHVISEVLQKIEIPGYDWLQQQEDYSILSEAMELSGIKERLWLDKYTILAENDSIYHKNGIFDAEDLINRIADSWIPISDRENSFYKFIAYHILYGEYYLNDLDWDNRDYWTMANKTVMIDGRGEIRINPGVDMYQTISDTGDTTVIDYVRIVWEACNYMTGTGPVHSITDLLLLEPLPE